jgi:hypothetical protein
MMRNQLSFSTFDPLFSDAPSLCDLCETQPSVFQFKNDCADDEPGCRPVKGFCCSVCATQLLEQLEHTESIAWAEEEASVRKEGGDISDLRNRRLAAFGTCERS